MVQLGESLQGAQSGEILEDAGSFEKTKEPSRAKSKCGLNGHQLWKRLSAGATLAGHLLTAGLSTAPVALLHSDRGGIERARE